MLRATPKSTAAAEVGTLPAKSRTQRSTRGASVAPASVFFLDVGKAGPAREWPALFDRCAALGCDAVLLSSPFVADQLLPPQGTTDAEPATKMLALLVQEAQQHGLALYLDVPLDRAAAGSPVVVEHADWFRVPPRHDAAALDPRRAAPPVTSLELSAAPAQLPAVTRYWRAQLSTWLDTGIAGFRLAAPARLQSLQQALVGDLATRAQFIDWRPASLLRAGLKSSDPAVTMLALLDGPLDHTANGSDEMLECACCQVRALAAGATHGVMLPMDFGRAALDAEGHLRPTSLITEALQTPAEPKVEKAAKASLTAKRAQTKVNVDAALAARRIVIANLDPSIDDGRYPSKRVVGDSVVVEADVFTDGHDQLAVNLLWRPVGAAKWNRSVMQPLGNDRFRGRFTLPELGRHEFTVEAWRDAWASFRSELRKKHGAGQRVTVEIDEGRHLIEAAAERTTKPLAEPLRKLIERLATASERDRIELLLDLDTATAMAAADDQPFATRLEPGAQIDAERSAAAFGAWYEIFPRSMSGDTSRHGNFDDVIAALPRIRDMGFDVLYMPPIHPIGKTNRKGRNNTLTPAPDDPGSPYAIGSPDGGHDAIHPQLGTLEDFRRMRDAAAAHGLELALDFAIQCSPDHPWLKDHP
ncbi:maltotransferase domain-containing protein, partial [Nevskia ramosa]|uniref:maltotransferase domain-containing protein n=1 Tax=Nevskia ramosa TaxID=64002 RepID=UPI002353A772